MDVVVPLRKAISRCGYLTVWELGAEARGESDNVSSASDRSVQVDGILAGASVVIEGSNDGVHYAPLSTLDGTWASIRQPGVVGIREYTYLVRPRVEGGSPSTAVVVSLMIRVIR